MSTKNITNEEIYAKMIEIEKRQYEILLKLDYIAKSCCKMDSHINFVDNVYDVIRRPFSTISRITLPSYKPTPSITSYPRIDLN
jgi:hypothetical protein